MFYEVLMEKRADALSKYVRRLRSEGRFDEAADALYKATMRSGGSSPIKASEMKMIMREGGKGVDDAIRFSRGTIKNAPTWEDYVPRMVDGKVNPTYFKAMKQMRRGSKRDTIGMISGGTTEAFDQLLRGGSASNMASHSAHLQDAAPGIALKHQNKGVWTVPRKRGGDSRKLDLYAGARAEYTDRRGNPSILHFDLPKALVRDEKQLRALQAEGKFMGGGSTGGIEYLIPGPVVNKFGRNFRQNKIVAESHPELARSQAVGNLLADSKLPESLRHRAGPAPSKRATDLPWARDARYDRGTANVSSQRASYVKKHGLGEEEATLLNDLDMVKRNPMDPFADLSRVDVDKLPKKMKKRLRRADWSEVEDFGDDIFPGQGAFLSALKPR